MSSKINPKNLICVSVFRWRPILQGVMRPLHAVLNQPLIPDLADIVEGVEEIDIRHLFVPIGPIEPFDDRILIRRPGLNVLNVPPNLRRPGDHLATEELEATSIQFAHALSKAQRKRVDRLGPKAA